MSVMPRCPNCSWFMHLSMDPPCHESLRCPGCGYATPRFPRFKAGQQNVRMAHRWVERERHQEGEDVETYARRCVNAYDRQDADALADAIEGLRGQLALQPGPAGG